MKYRYFIHLFIHFLPTTLIDVPRNFIILKIFFAEHLRISYEYHYEALLSKVAEKIASLMIKYRMSCLRFLILFNTLIIFSAWGIFHVNKKNGRKIVLLTEEKK